MTHQYILEVGMEEIPARFLKDLSQQLVERMASFLDDHRLTYDQIHPFATPRRLALMVTGLADKQADLSEKVKGPSLKIARQEDGQWSKAAQGFVRGQGASLDQILVESVKGEDYIFVDKFQAGRTSQEVLQDLDQVLASMTFPVTMHWHDYQIDYIRPVHWIVSLLDDQVVPFEFAGVTASNQSQGHRFLGQAVTIDQAKNYRDLLAQEFVIVDFQERQDLIKEQIQDLAQANHWQVPMDPDLLDEVTAIVEWPTAFYGDFDEDYLELPDMVLITAMRDHQRYFYALDQAGKKLQAIFISVRNGNSQHLDKVVLGNQKVLRARLEDALFFYKEDLKHSIDDYLEKLAHVSEHYKLGSLLDKQGRVKEVLKQLGHSLGASLDKEALATALAASDIYKFDLTTGMVDEFDELQGQIGAWYARQMGVDSEIAQAIACQYLPTSAEGQLPDSQAGALLAAADKLDTLLQYFNIGLIPTGSNDPYALRRQAMGLVEIIKDQAWDLDLLDLVDHLAQTFDLSAEDLRENLSQFFKARMEVQMQDVDYDIVDAVLSSSHLRVNDLLESGRLLSSFKEDQADHYRQMVEALTRVVNLGMKAESQQALDINLSETESETALLEQVLGLQKDVSVSDRLASFKDLVPYISAYFDHNMVNAEDDRIRANRYALMQTLTQLILEVMNPQKLISKF